MTSATSPVQICNLALSQAAARAQIQTLNPSDGTAAGDACSLLYQPTVDAFARAALWNCLRFQAPLSLLRAAPGTPENLNGTLPAPPQPFLYEYALPTDCLRARWILPLMPQAAVSPPFTTGSQTLLRPMLPQQSIPFTVAVDLDTNSPPNEVPVILTNLRQAQLVYTKRLNNVALWDAQFVMGVKAALACWLIPALNANMAMMGGAVSVAKAMLDSARISDGNEGPTSEDHTPDWIRIRAAGAPRAFGLWAGPALWDSYGFPDGSIY